MFSGVILMRVVDPQGSDITPGSARIDHLARAGEALSAARAGVGQLSAGEASVELVKVKALIARAEAYRVAVIARIDAHAVSERDTMVMLKGRHHLDHSQAAADLRAVRALQDYPELEQAADAGVLSRPVLDAITTTASRSPHRKAAMHQAAPEFIQLATQASLSQVRKSLEMWADQIDPTPDVSGEHDAHRRRELSIHHVRDGVKIDGFFPKIHGMRLLAALNGALDKQWRTRHDPTHTGHTTSSPGLGGASTTSPDQGGATVPDRFSALTSTQRADAFIDFIITPVLEHGLLPTCGGTPATIAVTIPIDRLTTPTQLGDPTEIRQRLVEGSLHRHSPILRASNGPGDTLISPTRAQQLACDATIQRVVTSPAGKPLDIGRRTRVIPEQIRTALIVRDNGCIFPHCGKPPGWTEGHHVQHWSQGGPTSLDNLVLLCSRHHHDIHSQHISITFDQDGIPHIHLKHQYRDEHRYRAGP